MSNSDNRYQVTVNKKVYFVETINDAISFLSSYMYINKPNTLSSIKVMQSVVFDDGYTSAVITDLHFNKHVDVSDDNDTVHSTNNWQVRSTRNGGWDIVHAPSCNRA
jgi:hypothetical protein